MAGVNRSPAVKAGWSRRTARDGRRVRQHRSRGSPETDFLSTPADICIYGDAAGGGKTVGLILEQLRHAGRVAGLTAVVLPAHDAANHQSGRALG
jgi:hypothetical protein